MVLAIVMKDHLAGEPETAQESTGEHRRAQDSPGEARRQQDQQTGRQDQQTGQQDQQTERPSRTSRTAGQEKKGKAPQTLRIN